jgi:drug/metabolite transporter (DMT)-like permease
MSDPTAFHWLALSGGILLTSVSQVLLKLGAGAGRSFARAFLNRYTVTGYVLFLGVTILNIFAMKAIPLRTVTAATSLTYAVTVGMGHSFLGEMLTRRTMLGVALIVVGIFVFSLAGLQR